MFQVKATCCTWWSLILITWRIEEHVLAGACFAYWEAFQLLYLRLSWWIVVSEGCDIYWAAVDYLLARWVRVAVAWNQSCTIMEAAMCGLTDMMEGGGGNGGPHSMNPYLNPKLRHNNNTMHPSPHLSTHLHPTIPDSRCCVCNIWFLIND